MIADLKQRLDALPRTSPHRGVYRDLIQEQTNEALREAVFWSAFTQDFRRSCRELAVQQ